MSEIPLTDLPVISQWFGKEIAVLRTPYGKLRVVLGERHGFYMMMLNPGEKFIVHTHPMAVSRSRDFKIDLRNAGAEVEAVIDWSGNVTYYSKKGFRNSIRKDDVVEPLLGYRAAFLDGHGRVVATNTVNIRDGATHTVIEIES